MDGAVQRCPGQQQQRHAAWSDSVDGQNNMRHGEDDGKWSDVHHRCHHPPDICVPAHTLVPHWRKRPSAESAELLWDDNYRSPERRPGAAHECSDGGFEKRRVGTGCGTDTMDDRPRGMGDGRWATEGRRLQRQSHPVWAARFWSDRAECIGQWRCTPPPLVPSLPSQLAARSARPHGTAHAHAHIRKVRTARPHLTPPVPASQRPMPGLQQTRDARPPKRCRLTQSKLGC